MFPARVPVTGSHRSCSLSVTLFTWRLICFTSFLRCITYITFYADRQTTDCKVISRWIEQAAESSLPPNAAKATKDSWLSNKKLTYTCLLKKMFLFGEKNLWVELKDWSLRPSTGLVHFGTFSRTLSKLGEMEGVSLKCKDGNPAPAGEQVAKRWITSKSWEWRITLSANVSMPGASSANGTGAKHRKRMRDRTEKVTMRVCTRVRQQDQCKDSNPDGKMSKRCKGVFSTPVIS